jgi:hypothetical protein
MHYVAHNIARHCSSILGRTADQAWLSICSATIGQQRILDGSGHNQVARFCSIGCPTLNITNLELY